MVEISVDLDLCKKDGLCAMVCPRGIFRQEVKRTHPQIVDMESCMGCGACVSICPGEAIIHSVYPAGTVTPIEPEILPTYDQVLELIRSRRSKREFRDKPVLQEDIMKVVEATRFAPSEHNVQDTEVIVVQDKKIIHEIAALASGYYKKLVTTLSHPIGRFIFRLMFGKRSTDAVVDFMPEMKGVSDLFDEGEDYILRQAPVLMIFCADSVGGFPEVNAHLAVQNAILAAEATGLACFFAGFVLRASRRVDEIGELVGLPDTHKIYGILALGYSRVKFRRWPERRLARVTWIGAK